MQTEKIIISTTFQKWLSIDLSIYLWSPREVVDNVFDFKIVVSDIFLSASQQTGLDPRLFFIVGVLGKGDVGHEPRLMPWWTRMLIGSKVAMWATWTR